MKKIFLLLSVFLSLQLFSQGSRYWIKFKDKDTVTYSVNNPLQYLSQASIDRRTKQHIAVNVSDLPVNDFYVGMLSGYVTRVIHRLKWFNSVVVQIDDPGMIHTDTTTAIRDTVFQNDTLSVTIYDSVIIRYRVNVSLSGTVYDTLTSLVRKTIYDSTGLPGRTIYTDSIFLTEASTGNKFDFIKQFPFVDSMGEIKTIPPIAFKMQNKFEEVYASDQHVIHPSKYGAAYHQINMLNADLLHQMGYMGEGITMAVMDNGFYKTDQINAYDSVRSQIVGTRDFVNDETNVYNDGSHGENVFSCMAANLPGKYLGTAPESYFYLLVTEDDAAEWVMEEYNWAAAAEYADSAGVQIFSTSLGYTRFDLGIGNHNYADMSGDKTVITRASNLAFEKGILVLNSAGNEGDKSWHYISAPADGYNVLTVGAVDSLEAVAAFSGRGPVYGDTIIKPDVCSQGVNSAIVGTDGRVGYSGGTSFSCPIMAGCAASLWSAFPDKSAKEIKDAIVISADHFWTPDNNHGYGIPNFYNAYLFLKTDYNTKVLRIRNDAVVYPNPFGSEFNVALFNTENKDRKIEVFDLLGRKVYSRDIFIRDKTFEIVKIEEAQEWAAGEYFLKLDGEKELVYPLIKPK